MVTDLGRRLILLRALYGISQRELAKRAGVPNSAISVMEQGKSCPTLHSLEKILNGFPLTLQQFLSEEPDRCSLRRIDDEAQLQHGYLDLLLFSEQIVGSVLVSEGYCQLIVVSGQLRVLCCNGSVDLVSGDRLGIESGTLYRVECLSDVATWVSATLRPPSCE